MSKKPIILFCQPIDHYFLWQCHLYIESCIKVGFDEERIQVLLYKPKGRDYDKEYWEQLLIAYPKLQIFIYEDKGVQQHLGTYIPILRPHTLWQHFLAHPELEKETILYTDCDILWIEGLDIEKLFDDDVCYVSDAKSYLNVSYFDSKLKDVLPEKLEEYKSRDIVNELCKIVGIDKKIVVENNDNTGGVQYILKNMTASFWKKIEEDVLKVRHYLIQFNKNFFKDENTGIQGWCSDLWVLQYNLWMKEGGCKTVDEMSFLWCNDDINRLEKTKIYHNAGATSTHMFGYPVFYKGKYHMGQNPLLDPHLQEVLSHEETKKHCTWYYANELNKLGQKYKLSY